MTNKISNTAVELQVDISHIDVCEPGQENFESLGALLIYLRRRHEKRMALASPGIVEPRVTAASVVKALNENNYPMTSGSYSLLEQGKTLPRSPNAFIEAIARSLGVEPTSKYSMLLRWQYLYDHALRYFGADVAEGIPHGSSALDALRAQMSSPSGDKDVHAV